MNKQKTGLRFISLWICLSLLLNSLWGCQVMPPQMTEIPPQTPNFQVKQVPAINPHLKLELEARSLYEDLAANTDKITIAPLHTSQRQKYHYANFRIHSDTAWILEIINANNQSVFSQAGEYPNAVISWWGEDLQGKTLPDGNYTVRISSGGEKIENQIQIQHQMSFALGLPGFPNSATEVLVLKPNDLPKQLAHIRIEPDQTENWNLSLKNPLGQEIFTVQDQGPHEFLWAPSYGEEVNMGGDYLLTLSQGQQSWKKIIRVESWLMVALGDRLSNEGNLPVVMTPTENQHRWIDISVKAPANTVWKLEIQSQEYALIYSHRRGKGPKELHWTGNRWLDTGVGILEKNQNGDWKWKGVNFSEPDTNPIQFPLKGNTNPSSTLLKPLFYPVPEGLYTISLHVSAKREALESLSGHPFYRGFPDQDFLLNRTTVKTQYSAPNELAIYTPPQASYNLDILEKSISDYKIQAEKLEKITREDLPDLPNFQVQSFQVQALERNSLNQPWYYTQLEPQPGEINDPLYNQRFGTLKKKQEAILAHLNWLHEANQAKFLAEVAPNNPNPDIGGLRKLYTEKLFGRIHYQASEIMAMRAAYRLEKIESIKGLVSALEYFFMFSANYINLKEKFANKTEDQTFEQQPLILRKANSTKKNTQIKLLSAKIQDNAQIMIRGRVENPSSDFDYSTLVPFFGTDLENIESRTVTPEGDGYFSMTLEQYDFSDRFFERIEEPGELNEIKKPEIQVKLFNDKLSSQNMALQLNEEQHNKLRALLALRKLGDQMIALGKLGQALAPIYAEQYGPGFKALAFQDCPSDGNGYSYCYPGVNEADEAARIALAEWELEMVQEEQARFQQAMDIVVPAVILAEVTVLTMGLPLFFAELGAFAYTSEAALMSGMPFIAARTLSMARISAKFLDLGLKFHMLSKMGKALFQNKTIQLFAPHIDELLKNTRSLGAKIQTLIFDLNPCGFSILAGAPNPCFQLVLKPKEISFDGYSDIIIASKLQDELAEAAAILKAEGQLSIKIGDEWRTISGANYSVSEIGPVLTVVADPLAKIRPDLQNRIYYGTNLVLSKAKNFGQKEAEEAFDLAKSEIEKLHPILKERVYKEFPLLRDKELFFNEKQALSELAGDTEKYMYFQGKPWDPAQQKAYLAAGTHSEIYSIDQALKYRESINITVTEKTLEELKLMNIQMRNRVIGEFMERCSLCKVITKGATDYSHPDMYFSIFKENQVELTNKMVQARETLKGLSKR